MVLLVLYACSQKKEEITITLGGDIMLARSGEAIFKNGNGTVINPWSELEDKGIIKHGSNYNADYFFANLESPLGQNSSSSGEMNLCSDPAEVSLLLEGNLSLVSLANNHRDDCQVGGDQVTQEILLENGILSVRGDFEPVYFDTPQGRLAVLAAEDVSSPVDIDDLTDRITKARTGTDFVIVSMHWGNEYQAGPDENQENLAQRIADAGADVIWGHHPHVLQRMEWLRSSTGRDVLVLFSLGNLLSDQWMLEDAQRSALVKLTFEDMKINQIEIYPVRMNRSEKRLQSVTDQKTRDQIIDRLQVEELIKENVVVIVR